MALTGAAQRADYNDQTGANVGAMVAASAPYVTVEEYGGAIDHQTVINCVNLPVVTGNTTGISFGSVQLYTFPEGRILVKGTTTYFSTITFNTIAGSNADIGGGGSGDYSIGTTATADGTLATTEVDILPSTAMLDPFVTGVGRSNVGSALAASAQFDGTSTAITSYLNVIIDDADVSDGAANDNVYFTGKISISWSWLGDY